MPTGIQTTLTVWDRWGSLRGDPVPLLRGWWRRCMHWEQWGPLWWNYSKVADKGAPLVGHLSLTQTLQELAEREHTLWRAGRAQRAVPSHTCKAGTQLAYNVQEVIWSTPIWQHGKQAERHTATSPSHELESQSAIHLGFSSPWPAVFSYPSTLGWRGVRRWRKILPKSLQGMHCALTLTAIQKQKLSPSILTLEHLRHTAGSCEVERSTWVNWSRAWGSWMQTENGRSWLTKGWPSRGSGEQTYKKRKCSKDGQGPDRGGGGRGTRKAWEARMQAGSREAWEWNYWKARCTDRPSQKGRGLEFRDMWTLSHRQREDTDAFTKGVTRLNPRQGEAPSAPTVACSKIICH